jgi:hypothetical protein
MRYIKDIFFTYHSPRTGQNAAAVASSWVCCLSFRRIMPRLESLSAMMTMNASSPTGENMTGPFANSMELFLQDIARVTFHGRVVDCRQTGKGRYAIGIEFLDLKARDYAVLSVAIDYCAETGAENAGVSAI